MAPKNLSLDMSLLTSLNLYNIIRKSPQKVTISVITQFGEHNNKTDIVSNFHCPYFSSKKHLVWQHTITSTIPTSHKINKPRNLKIDLISIIFFLAYFFVVLIQTFLCTLILYVSIYADVNARNSTQQFTWIGGNLARREDYSEDENLLYLPFENLDQFFSSHSWMLPSVN